MYAPLPKYGHDPNERGQKISETLIKQHQCSRPRARGLTPNDSHGWLQRVSRACNAACLSAGAPAGGRLMDLNLLRCCSGLPPYMIHPCLPLLGKCQRLRGLLHSTPQETVGAMPTAGTAGNAANTRQAESGRVHF